jgi:phenylalanyl-tRNA synthetase beta chain
MKVTLSWLRTFAPFGDDVDELADHLADLGLAVEELTRLGEQWNGVVVAQILGLRPHPGADRIQLVDVDRGDGQILQIACGAFNMAVGDHVPLATLGTTMPNGLTIERRKMRGEWSNGMLCAADELGLGDDHAGIMILDPATTPGTPLAEVLGVEPDIVFDLEVNANRPDAMSVAGVARDLAARLGLPFAIPRPELVDDGPPVSDRASVEIIAPELCGRFLVRIIDGVTVGESPDWMANRLLAAGMRPINSVVDISNYVMLELGQPNHTYDLALVPEGHLGTRWARDGETIVTLDGAERTLTGGDGVIVDRTDTAIGIAGVMGGASTEISGTTTSVLLEMAWWHPMTVARSSSRLGLRSEASARFERGADPEIAELAAARFCELLLQTSPGANVAAGTIDVQGQLPDRTPVRVRTARVNAILGLDLDAGHITELLAPIGFACAPAGDDLDITIPSFRYDSTAEVDVIEEVARTYGYANIPTSVPKALAGRLTDRQLLRRDLAQILIGLGCDEAMPMPFLAPGDLDRAGAPADAVVVANPLDANESVLRTSLRPGLLKALAYNASHRQPDVRFYEVGRVFHRPPPGGDQVLPDEPEQLAVALGGEDATEAVGVLRALAGALGLDVSLRAAEVSGLHPTRTAEIVFRGGVLGAVGEIDPAVAEAFEVPGRVGWIELDLAPVFALGRAPRQARPVSTYPSSDLDLAFEVADRAPAGAVERTIGSAGGDLVVSVARFDVYRGPGVAEGHRSLAYRLRLQAPDHTLTDAEIGGVRNAVIAAVTAKQPATLRS